MTLESFNGMDAAAAAGVVRPCADIDGWVEAIVDARPFASVEDALAFADREARGWTREDVDAALDHHPRIGERAAGESTEASMSRSEQAGVDADADVTAALLEGNRAYEDRFGRVFLIRAAGRAAHEILAELYRRLENPEGAEAVETAQQLREIALLRLEGTLRS